MKGGREPEAEAPERAEPEGAEGAGDAAYRRRPRPVRVRRQRAADWLRAARRHWRPLLAGAAALALGAGAEALLFHSGWFVLRGSDQIAVSGNQHTAAASVLAVFSADLGRNIFFIPLQERRQAIEALPWVRRATVLRVWPARLEVRISEREPVAFARVGEGLRLVDEAGVLLDLPAQGHYDFPVLDGLAGAKAAEANAPRWRRQRVAQMQQYEALRAALDRHGEHHSRDLSEVDLSDPSDVGARVAVPGGGTVLIHFGDRSYGARYALFLSQIAGWLQKYPALASVDLHYEGEAIVDPGTGAAAAEVAPVPGSQAGAKKPAGKAKAAQRAARRG